MGRLGKKVLGWMITLRGDGHRQYPLVRSTANLSGRPSEKLIRSSQNIATLVSSTLESIFSFVQSNSPRSKHRPHLL